ncbi:DUF3108 domain-containing protein [Aquincola tertiaricarbonis]|uniref:DUF3108 domain-containing protein n=1 Tax=Aquincola tertiaricarbonis TaxID=391953 RepID=UPI000614B88E|nr:DUF3108 domain-containing protein [Aquincola tertiaricarbonis]
MAGLLSRPGRGGRRLAALAVAVAVLAGHLWLSSRVSDALVSAGGGDRPAMQRMDVAFVRELQQAAPPVAAPVRAAPPAPARRQPQPAPPPEPAASAASAPDAPTEAEVEPVPGLVAQAPELPPEPASGPASEPVPDAAAAASAAEMAAAPAPTPAASPPLAAFQPLQVASASAPAFEWPPSTRLDYVLNGNYRGEVNGHARVQWIRQAQRYQVHVDVVVGPSFAPLVARRMTSEGAVTPGGLVPQAYEEVTSTLFGKPRRRGLRFEPDRIVLDKGTAEPWPGVQDTASQFVQLTWLFTTQPQLLRVGQALEFPLALPRRIDRWHYDVVAEETLYTRVGELRTFHVKPRRESTRPGELTAELWFAPTLQYLPVRILIRHEGDTYVDLMLDAPPLQTE